MNNNEKSMPRFIYSRRLEGTPAQTRAEKKNASIFASVLEQRSIRIGSTTHNGPLFNRPYWGEEPDSCAYG